MPERRPHWPWYLLIAAAVLLVFGQTITFDFSSWDDQMLVTGNPYVNPPSLAKSLEAWSRPHANLFIPLTYNLWAGIASIATTATPDASGTNLNPFVFHLANVLVHLANAVLVYHILLILLDRRGIAAIAALIWAIHPIQVEPVTWVTGMKDLLSSFLALLATWIYLATARQQGNQPLSIGRLAGYLAATVAMGLAGMAKPGIVGMPAVAAILDLLILRRPLRRVLLPTLLLALAVVPAVWMTRISQPGWAGTYVTPLATRPLIAGHALTTYLQKLVWPDAFAVDYGLTPKLVLASTWGKLAWIIPTLLTGTLLAYFAMAHRRKPASERSTETARWLLAAWLVFLAGVGPVLGLSPFVFQFYSTVADRYVYLSMLGVAIALVLLLTRLPAHFAAIAMTLVIIALVTRATLQVMVWQDGLKLSLHTLTVNPRSFADSGNAGIAYSKTAAALREAAASEPDPARREAILREAYTTEDTALRYLSQSRALYPQGIPTLNSLARIYANRGDIAESLNMLEQAVDSLDAVPEALAVPSADRLTVAKICMNLKQYDRAAGHLRKWLLTHPNNPEALDLLRQAESSTTRPATTPAN